MQENIKKVLIVEDDLSLRPVWNHFFKHWSNRYEVQWVVSCEEAVKLIRQENQSGTPFSIIITDIFLAGSGTGMELLESEETKRSGAKTVLISSVDRIEVLQKFGHLLPDTEVLSKPFDFKKYEALIGPYLKSL